MSNNCKVSIIMGIYNCENTISEAIDSIINQTYKDWELIMCDDKSTDNTYFIAKEYEDKYPNKIKVIINDKNITLAPTLNRCLKLAKGKYIARQDGDDISKPNRLEEEVSFLESNPQYDLVATNMISFDENGEKGIHQLKEIPNKFDFLNKGSVFSHATIVMKAEVMKALGGYCEEEYANQAEDYELWSRFFLHGYKGYNMHKNLYMVREDMNAYRRRSVKRRIRGIKLNLRIYSTLNAPIICYKNIIKDLIAIIIPTKIFSYYYKFKLKKIHS